MKRRAGQARTRLVLPEDIREREHVAGGFDAIRWNRLKLMDILQDGIQLRGELGELIAFKAQTRQQGDLLYDL